MKKTFLIVILCFEIISSVISFKMFANEMSANNPPTIPTLFRQCDDDSNPNDGYTSFDLISFVGDISGYSINFFTDQMQTQMITSNPFVNIYPANQTIFYTLTNNSDGSVTVGTITLSVLPIPNVNQPQPIILCDNDGVNDGYYMIDLSSYNNSILGTLNPYEFTVNYFPTLADASSNTNAIQQTSYYSNSQTIYVRVTDNIFGCFTIIPLSITIFQRPTPFITTTTNVLCVDFLTNNIQNSVVLTAGDSTFYNFTAPSYTYQWYNNGVAISGATSATYTITNSLPNSSSSSYQVQMTPTNSSACQSEISNSLYIYQSGQASLIGIGYTIVNNNGNHTLTVQVDGYGIYGYSIDGLPTQSSPVFENLSIGTHTLTVYDTEGGMLNSCDPIVISNIEVTNSIVAPPTGSTIQYLVQGSTLADIQVVGQNIMWYATATSNKNSNTVQQALPITTVLQNGQTYFASQKIGGYESEQRLPVTVFLTVLNNENFNAEGFELYPNPVSNYLNIKSEDFLKDIIIYNQLGQKVYHQEFQKLSSTQIDLSFLLQGTYIAVIKSNSKQIVSKIIKK